VVPQGLPPHIAERGNADAPMRPQMDAGDKEVWRHAITESVKATSTGNPEEDAMIAQAIEASLSVMNQAVTEQPEDKDALQQVRPVADSRTAPTGITANRTGNTPVELLTRGEARSSTARGAEDDPGVESGEDENMRIALEQSKRTS